MVAPPCAGQTFLADRTLPPPQTLPPSDTQFLGGNHRAAAQTNQLWRRTSQTRVPARLQPQRHCSPPAPAPAGAPAQEKARHKKAPPLGKKDLEALRSTLGRYQVFAGYSSLLASNESPPLAPLPIHGARSRLRSSLRGLRR